MSHRRLITPVVAALLLLAPSLGAQQQVTGRVVNSQTGASVSAVQVFIAGSGIGALSQQNGRYLLLNVPVGTHTLTAQRIGYGQQSAEVTVAAGATVVRDFALAEQALGLDEIIVTGTAGGARQREVGTAVTRLDASDLMMRTAIPSLGEALQGQVTGLQMSQSGGQGTAPNINFRGGSSVSQSNAPLFYVNGVRMYSRQADTGTRGSGSYQFNPIAHIKAADIERIEVVRGPAATTLYGTEGSGGVIQIFTRRGSADLPTQWSAGVTMGANSLTHAGPKKDNPNALGFKNCLTRLTSAGDVFRDITCPADGDWIKPALIQRYNVSVSGGTAGFTYAISGRLADEGSPIDGSGIGFGASTQYEPMDERVGWSKDGGFRGNFTLDLTPTLHAEWSTSLSINSTKYIPTSLGSAYGWVAPMQRGLRGAVQAFGEPASGLHFKFTDPFERRQQWMQGFNLSHLPSSNFDHRLSVGFDLNEVDGETWYHVGHPTNREGFYDKRDWRAGTTTFDYGANFRASLRDGDITSTTSAGFQAYRETERSTLHRIKNFPGQFEVPTLVSGSNRQIISDRIQNVVNAGGYVQQVFGWKDYFFLTAGLRVDGNSAFGSGFGLQPYPKLSVSYVLSDMDFWPSDWFENFRLRGAVGEAGKAPGAFDAVRSWSPIVGRDDQPGFTPGALGDPDLGPERSREYEVGFDASLYGGRVTAEVTGFHRTTYDALIPIRYPASLGFITPQLTNAGTLRAQGAEISLDVGLMRTRLIDWNVGVLYSRLTSEALDLAGRRFNLGYGSSITGAAGWAREGFPVPAVFGTRTLNVGELAEPILEKDSYFGPGYPVHQLGLRTSVTILNDLTISAFGEWQAGAYKHNQTGQRMTINDTHEPCLPAMMADRKRLAGDPSDWNQFPAEIRAKCSVVPANHGPDRWYEKIDFFKLRTVNLSYQLPAGLVPGTQSATLRASGNNLLKISDYWGQDPEARVRSLFPGTDYHGLPPYKTYTVALNVAF